MTQDTHADRPRLLDELRADLAAISEMVTARIENDDRDYGDAALDHHELAVLVADSLEALLDSLGGASYSLEPARGAGRLKAERGIPLDSLLHAFRVAGMAFWEVIVERADDDDRPALPRLSTLMWATVDEYSVAAAEAYRRVVVAGTEQPDQRLLRALLDPGFPATQRAGLGRRMRLPARATFVVLVGDVHLVANGLTTVRTRLAEDRVTLAAAVSPVTLGRALRTVRTRAGASKPFTDLVATPTALDQARLAFRCLSEADIGIHTYASSPARALIAANPGLAADVLSDALAAFDRLHPDDADALVRTALAWYELGGSTSAVGERLHLHRNTVLHRLKRIERLTGAAFAVPADAALLYLALQTLLLRAPGDKS
ncbi:helix-turn-helix domain-containing protein [Nocardia bhagyanarayanae]|uniref:PucR-like helix-turn-helix protein n=1 Tax=Nocardia bhagyanarayanae TaxID=1215925 RepID=A0A543FGG2_9NOCA|nr:helix-turn-helix domain-containing protein [Nocardia bhagyanarayanae]TQM32915.1 PucR-like helix-turn-helix protein [Nocardia bhagyanarayanae]